ncbi:Hypothetical predicted protein [Olea europaea subsp. europaea]|uniref:Uncharacterized protein n=1 Tax=Olea europaea subsp. europaea TaxID=158383 RepID=A0A8S0V6X3_OLEEU|nr:Hypothetical predicted protein [Olea europaea subsp. europaea]
MKFKDEVLITSSKNLIAVILLTASSLAFIQRHGKIRASLRSLAATIFKYQDKGATTTTEKLEEEGGLELDCVTFKMKNTRFTNCIDLHWTYDSTAKLNPTVSVAFIAPPTKLDGWVTWALNPVGYGCKNIIKINILVSDLHIS